MKRCTGLTAWPQTSRVWIIGKQAAPNPRDLKRSRRDNSQFLPDTFRRIEDFVLVVMAFFPMLFKEKRGAFFTVGLPQGWVRGG
jgi:hypothetical protein